MVDETVVKVAAAQVSVTSGALDFEDTLLNGQGRHIGDSGIPPLGSKMRTLRSPWTFFGSSGFVGNSEDVGTGDGTVLHCVTLRVVEVSWDAGKGVLPHNEGQSVADRPSIVMVGDQSQQPDATRSTH